jgi:hypothetical protein
MMHVPRHVMEELTVASQQILLIPICHQGQCDRSAPRDRHEEAIRSTPGGISIAPR